MTPGRIIQEIKDLSRQIGFVDMGIVLPRPPDHYNSFLAWLDAGHAAGMRYLGAERSLGSRAQPLSLMPECRSIIMLLTRYSSAVDQSGKKNPGYDFGVALYAHGEDYHHVINEMLGELTDGISRLVGHTIKTRGFTDSAPILERELAVSAGLGWVGKNSCLISTAHGSFTFIAELFTDLPLQETRDIVPDRCGRCHRCIDACPTQCILPDRTIAAERCISYLTIENRDQIPIELRKHLGKWIFGCDVCQTVCPWNNKVGDEQVDKRFVTDPHFVNIKLEQEIYLKEDDFRKIFEKSPLLRTKRSGYLRNVAIALGNQGKVETRKILLEVIHNEPDAIIRAAAVWAVGQMLDTHVAHELYTLLNYEKNEIVRREIDSIFDGSIEKSSPSSEASSFDY